MNVIRKAAIMSCGFAISVLMSEFSIAQVRVIRTVPSTRSSSRTIRVQRVVPSSSARRVTVPSSRFSPSPSTRRPTLSPSSRVVATKSQAEEKARRAKAESADDDIPKEALLTERGVELAAQLKRLRYTESSLGSRHPSLKPIQDQIVSIRRILISWGKENDTISETKDKELVIVSNELLDSLSKDDLKQLVVKLATDLSKIRQRLDELEEDQLASDES